MEATATVLGAGLFVALIVAGLWLSRRRDEVIRLNDVETPRVLPHTHGGGDGGG